MSFYQSEMKVPIRPAPPPPVSSTVSQKVSKPLTAWNGSGKSGHIKGNASNPRKKPPPRPPPPKFVNKQDKKPVPARPSQLITNLFHKKNNAKIGDQLSRQETVDSKGNNVLSLIDFNSPPSSPTFTTRSSSDALSVNSFGSDGITPCSTSSGNTSNVESGFEDDFDFFLNLNKKPDIAQNKDPWSPEPTSKAVKSNAWVAFPTSAPKKNSSDVSAMPTIIRVKPERPKFPLKEKVTSSESNVNVLAEIFENHTFIEPTKNTLFNSGAGSADVEDEEDDGWSSESPPMPTCPPPAPPLEVLQSLFENNSDVLGGCKPHGVALYDYTGDHAEDLSFKENDIINLVRRIDGNWFLGELNGVEGTVPANFIAVQVPIPGDELSGDRHVTALYPFHAETWQDLELQVGSVINVLGRINQDWLYGESNGRSGQFPANFVDRIPPDLPIRKN